MVVSLVCIAMRMSVCNTVLRVRMDVTFMIMGTVGVTVGMLMTVVVTTAALGYLNIKMSFLIAHGYIYCSVTGSLGCEFKMVHSAMVGIGCGSVALAAQPEQQ